MTDIFITPQVAVVQEILIQPVTTIEVLVPGLTGPRGPAGAGEQYFYAGPISSIGQAHGIGRIPAICVYVNNELVGISVSMTPTSVAIEFPFPAYNVRIILT